MSYYDAHHSERGVLTEQFSHEPTGYSGMGAAVRAPSPLRTAMPRVGVQPTPQLRGRTVIRRAGRLIIPRLPTMQPAPRPPELSIGPSVRPLTPPERLQVTALPEIDPPPQITYREPPAPPQFVPAPPPPSAPPLPDDVEEYFDVDAIISEAEGGEALEELQIEAPGAKPTKEFPWKTVGVVAGVATVLYLMGKR